MVWVELVVEQVNDHISQLGVIAGSLLDLFDAEVQGCLVLFV